MLVWYKNTCKDSLAFFYFPSNVVDVMNINLHFFFFWDNLTLHLVSLGNANHINSAARLQGDLHCIPWKWETHFSSFIFIKRKIFPFKPFDKKQLRIPGISIREQSCNHPEVSPFTPQCFCLPPLLPSLSAYLHNVIKRAVIITAAPEEHTKYRRFLVGSCTATLAAFQNVWKSIWCLGEVLGLPEMFLKSSLGGTVGHTWAAFSHPSWSCLVSQVIVKTNKGVDLLRGNVVPSVLHSSLC